MARLIETSIDQLIPDNKNFNKHSEFGMRLLEKSVGEFGLGRSILIDKNNRIICGNGVTETAAQLDLNNVLIVDTDGKQLVAVRRNDLDLDSRAGRELALADNAVAKANITLDTDLVLAEAEALQFNPEDWGVACEQAESGNNEESGGGGGGSQPQLVVTGDLTKLSLLFSELQERGFGVTLNE